MVSIFLNFGREKTKCSREKFLIFDFCHEYGKKESLTICDNFLSLFIDA